MSADRVFVDTNVLVYAYDVESGAKHERAASALRSLWAEGAGAISTQVLQEFYVTVTRKIPVPLTAVQAREVVGTYAAWPTHRPDPTDILVASELEGDHQLSFWDALILVSAQRSQASVLLTEDLTHGQTIRGVTAENPFRP